MPTDLGETNTLYANSLFYSFYHRSVKLVDGTHASKHGQWKDLELGLWEMCIMGGQNAWAGQNDTPTDW